MGVMAIKEYSIFLKIPGLELHHQMVSYPGYKMEGGSYPSAEMQSAYSTIENLP